MATALPAYGDRRSATALLTMRDRAGALVLVALIHVGLVALLLLLQTHPEAIEELKERLTVVEVRPPEPPPPPPPPPRDVSPNVAPRPVPNAPAPMRMPDIAAPAPVQPPIVFPPTVPVPPGEASSGSGSTGEGEAARGEGGGNGTGGTGQGGGPAGGAPPARPAADGPISGRWIPRSPPPLSISKTGEGAPRAGWATLMCRTAERDRLSDCVPRQESHAGFAAALLEASARFRYRATDSKGKRVIGMSVQVYLPVRERR